MQKKDIANQLAEEYNITKKDALNYVNTVFEVITSSLAKEESVDIYGFGRFSVIERKEHSGTNPWTKEKMQINTVKTVKFKTGRVLKDAVKK